MLCVDVSLVHVLDFQILDISLYHKLEINGCSLGSFVQLAVFGVVKWQNGKWRHDGFYRRLMVKKSRNLEKGQAGNRENRKLKKS